MNKVYLVGAGPGDPELLTIKAMRLIQLADVVVYDRLVNPLLLHLAKPEAEFLYAGKGPKKHTLRQQEINQKLVMLAKMGKNVVRLKGGDPAIFGRVGEEMAELARSGVPYEVVPGITSASAAASYSGFPLTHRDYSSQITFLTGHMKNDLAQKNNLHQLAENGTLAFYMSIENLAEICRTLFSESQKDYPVAVIEWASYGRQKVVSGHLTTIKSQLKEAAIKNPALVLIGNIVSLRKATSWFEKLPYFGRKLVLTSRDEISFEQATAYTSLGADVWIMPNLASPDKRFDEVTKRQLTNYHFFEVVCLKEQNQALFTAEMKRLGIAIPYTSFVESEDHYHQM